MENSSNNDNLVLLGLVEMEGLKYLYSALSIVTYTYIVLLSSSIVLVILTEKSLHEPMYILILNLTVNGIFGSSSFFPKFISDLLTSSKTVLRTPCHIQVLCLMTFTFFEMSTFTIMAYDQYLAVSHPLRYVTLMTTEKTAKLILSSLVLSFTIGFVAVLMSSKLRLCGSEIKNIFCDNMSFLILSCTDTSANNVYGLVASITFLIFAAGIILFSYIQIVAVCIRVTRYSHKKALHTLLTHLLNFSIFLVGAIFVFVRLRLNSGKLPLYAHTLLSASLVVFPPFLNPLIYGIRTKALRVKMARHLMRLF